MSDHGPKEAAYLAAVLNRWHRLTPAAIDDLQLAPRASLTVWPDLSPDVKAVRATIDGLAEYVWENQAGGIQSVIVSPDVEEFPDDAIAAAVHPLAEGEYNPLLVGVLPDPDGVLRARWSA